MLAAWQAARTSGNTMKALALWGHSAASTTAVQVNDDLPIDAASNQTADRSQKQQATGLQQSRLSELSLSWGMHRKRLEHALNSWSKLAP
jgi:hypothetical protein